MASTPTTPSSKKRRRASSNSQETTYEKYCVTAVTLAKHPPSITSCGPNNQLYDLSSALEAHPPYHPFSFQFDEWVTPDVTLNVGGQSFKGHKKHLKKCCAYFEGMFNPLMAESKKSDITIYEVDETSFQSIFTCFYTGSLSLCTDCVVSVLRTATFLHSSVILNACEHFILGRMDLNNVFLFLEVSCELSFERIRSQALQIICSNLGPPASLSQCDAFLALTPPRMALILSGYHTNCTETDLATAIMTWAALQYDLVAEYIAYGACNTSFDSGIGLDFSVVAQHYRDTTQHCTIKISEAHLNTLAQTLISGVGLDFSTAGNSADYAVDVVDRRPEIVDLTSPEPAASRSRASSSDIVASTSSSNAVVAEAGPSTSTPTVTPSRGKGKNKLRRRNSESESTPESGRYSKRYRHTYMSRKRKRTCSDCFEEEGEGNVLSSQQPITELLAHNQIGEVLNMVEYNNMEVETLKALVETPILQKFPSLCSKLRVMVERPTVKCVPERGSYPCVTMCYHRSYRSNENTSRTIIIYYNNGGRWLTLDESFDTNLYVVKATILHNYMYIFGMHRVVGRVPSSSPKCYRFNQFTGQWRELWRPPVGIGVHTRCFVHEGVILIAGAHSHQAGHLSIQHQQSYVKLHSFTPDTGKWRELNHLPFTNYALQRYVSSIISHNGLLFYVEKNKLYSYDINSTEKKELTTISLMFANISNYWLFAKNHLIFLIGGLCTTQEGGNWENREILIFNMDQKSWTVLQNDKPSPMYEMMGGMILDNKIYTVSHGHGDNMAKVELFDIVTKKWAKGSNMKYETPSHCTEYGISIGCMLVKAYPQALLQ